MTRLGYQIPNFTYPGTAPADIFPTVVRQAREAEASGFDTVLAMDHFYQLPMLGPPENAMLECYTLLSALAQHTDRVRLSALVTGNTYRNPALLAKELTTLDHVSGGRAQLGIGAGWFELEHDSLGFEFGTFTDRFERLEEALQIVKGMLAGERPTFRGRWYRVTDAINSPAPLSKIPVLIGGAGEKKTLRLVAKYADESNLICAPNEVPRKLEVLAEHCEALGRDRCRAGGHVADQRLRRPHPRTGRGRRRRLSGRPGHRCELADRRAAGPDQVGGRPGRPRRDRRDLRRPSRGRRRRLHGQRRGQRAHRGSGDPPRRGAHQGDRRLMVPWG